ncbi:hypothetical protein NLG97_g10044 [Lecanicillium saksenae]|uniref:Uncharacterized protein n=1 Tax=Lecanicillium saksenae TaxID=468837 RepID=A0ACC1QI86_9HYPO|nr:hypothetical protein NLG97_g10044 [Lecanicillium saksenae]
MYSTVILALLSVAGPALAAPAPAAADRNCGGWANYFDCLHGMEGICPSRCLNSEPIEQPLCTSECINAAAEFCQEECP